MNNDNKGSFFTFIAGIVAGVAGAIYYTKNKKDINKNIQDVANTIHYKTKKTLHDAGHSTSQALNTTGDKLGKWGNGLSDRINKTGSDISHKIDETVNNLNSEIENTKEKVKRETDRIS